jgi:hypothetical protein
VSTPASFAQRLLPRLRRRPDLGRVGLLVGLGLLTVATTGCHATGMHATSQPAVPAAGNAELVQYVSNQPYLTAEPAYRAVYALAHGQAFAGGFDELTAALVAENVIGKDWEYASNRVLNRAAVGFMICRAAGIHTGINWNLTGLGRYAWRELTYHRIAEGGGELAPITGGEFVGVLARADDYMQRHGRHEDRNVELGSRER